MATALAPARPLLHPLHAIFLAFPIAMFTGALLSDITYLNTAEIQWSNFSAWFITGALLFGAPAAIWSVVLVFTTRERGYRSHTLVYALLVWVALLAGLVNAFQHGQDAWSSVGATGLALSIVSTVTALGAAWTGYSSGRRMG